MVYSRKKIIPIALGFFSLCFLLLASVAFAETKPVTFTPLVGLPGIQTSKDTSLPDYINSIYLLSISIGAILGVMRIAWAGVRYSLSDVVTSKEAAKSDIWGVLLGLAILLVPFIVLNTIYPGLTNLDVLKAVPKTKLGTVVAPPDSTKKATDINKVTIGSIPDSIRNPETGIIIENCRYSEIKKEFVSGRVIEGGYKTVYDNTSCMRSCSEKIGTFQEKQPWYATCTYKALSNATKKNCARGGCN